MFELFIKGNGHNPNGQKWRGYSLKIYLGATAGNEKQKVSQ